MPQHTRTEIDKLNLFSTWKVFVNLETVFLERFMKTKEGKLAGLPRKKAKALGLKSGRESARAILRMRKKKFSKWTKNDFDWAQRQISFIKRMRGMRGPYFKKGKDGLATPTRKLTALLIWGHNPCRTKKDGSHFIDFLFPKI